MTLLTIYWLISWNYLNKITSVSTVICFCDVSWGFSNKSARSETCYVRSMRIPMHKYVPKPEFSYLLLPFQL